MPVFDPTKAVPQDIAEIALKLKHYMEENHITSIYGMGDIYKARRDLRTELCSFRQIGFNEAQS